uniref:Lipoate--protein ligase family protein n=1 Tax=candidate division WOR-3 bacterium TaxID=2052148 RepID=A0A7C6AFT8_UNCW3
MVNRDWRLLDTGVLTAAENMALDEMLLELRAKNLIPNTLRILQFNPPAALVGFHQSIEQEIRVDYCNEMGIDINRRITGGGAIYFDRTQLGWEIICSKQFFNHSMPNVELFKKLSLPVIDMLGRLGIRANFRGRNDIEVNGRKISGTGGAEWGNAFLFQGTLLVDFDVDTMLRALRIPIEKLKRHEIDSLKERVTCIKWELGYTPDIKIIKDLIKKSFEKHFGIKLFESKLTEVELKEFQTYLEKFRSNKWIHKVRLPSSEQPVLYITRLSKAGKIKAFFTLNLRHRRIQSAIFIGDFFAYPARAIFDLEALFKEIPLEKELIIQKMKEHFQHQKNFYIPNAKITDFIKIIEGLFEKLKLIELGIPPEESNRIFLVNGTYEGVLNQKPNHLLLPYCAKSTECSYRYKNQCEMCKECTVGDAYRLAFETNMKPITITSFEDLITTLKELKRIKAPAYIGCCCEQFFTKHQDAFESAGIPAILLDINNETCYDLGKAAFAYRGEFESQTSLNLKLLKKVLDGI